MTGGNGEISFTTSQGRFNFRVAGVAIDKGRVLLTTEDRFDFWYLPGGRVSMFESSTQAIEREVFEELGERSMVERLLWTTECMYHFVDWNISHHDVTFYYLIRFTPDARIYATDSGIGTEAFSNEPTVLHYRWIDLDQLKARHLVPSFLKEGLQCLPVCPEHLIINELTER